MTWKIGDAVRVKDGFIDEETDHDMSGWQGRIKEFGSYWIPGSWS